MKELVEGFVIEGFPFVFESKELAVRAMFPAKGVNSQYEEKEEVRQDAKHRDDSEGR